MAESYPQVKPQRQPPHFTVGVAGYRATNAAAERLHSGVGNNNNYTALRQSFLGTTTSTPMFRHNGQTVGRICKSIYRRRRTARAAGRPIASTGPRRRSGRALGQARLAAPRSGRYMRHYASTQALLPDRNTIPSRQPQSNCCMRSSTTARRLQDARPSRWRPHSAHFAILIVRFVWLRSNAEYLKLFVNCDNSPISISK